MIPFGMHIGYFPPRVSNDVACHHLSLFANHINCFFLLISGLRVIFRPLILVLPLAILIISAFNFIITKEVTTLQKYTSRIFTLPAADENKTSLHPASKSTPPIDISLTPPNINVTFTSYVTALQERASKDRVIYLAYVDLGFIDMVNNFIESSIIPHNISNYLFISSNTDLCHDFKSRNIPCYVYMNTTSSDKPSMYGTSVFKKKMNIRTYMILEALQAGFNVIHTDVDVHFFKDPFPAIRETCHNTCDAAPLWDGGASNAGFLYVRNTSQSIAMYKHMEHLANTTNLDDQTALNRAIKATKGIKIIHLPTGKFQCGKLFFTDGHRHFAGDHPCTECIVAHNNWIASSEAKVYRFKEMHLWVNDKGKYYSDPNRKYISYNNFQNFSDPRSWPHEKKALINALAIGLILNRTVILPKFTCSKAACTILDKLKMRVFDHNFGTYYREHTFLSHPKVPEAIRNSQSCIIVINSDEPKNKTCEVYTPKNHEEGATSGEISQWFANHTEAVLNVHSLYNAFWKFTDSKFNEDFFGKAKKAFAPPGRYQI